MTVVPVKAACFEESLNTFTIRYFKTFAQKLFIWMTFTFIKVIF